MRVIVFGGHGKVALLLSPLLAARGDEVVSVIRNPAHADEVAAGGAEPRVLDLESASPAEIDELLAGADAVVWSAGAGGGNRARTAAVARDAAIATIEAARRSGVSRYVMVSWYGSVPDHGVDPDDSFFPYVDAKLAADDHLRGTDLDWTILGPGPLTLDEPTGRIAVDPPEKGPVPRADVAAVIVGSLDEPASIGGFVRFATGDTPIADALRH
jgi:uncharacterized protein YbjT (DUF2867 family)